MRSSMEGWTTIRWRSEAPSHERCLGRKNQRRHANVPATADEVATSPDRLCQPLPGVKIMSMAETTPPAQVGYAQEAMQQLREAIQHLGSEEKVVFLLRQNGTLTYEQIAQRDNRSVDVVKEQMRS